MSRSRKAGGDADLFAHVMRDVRPLRRRNVISPPVPLEPPRPARLHADTKTVIAPPRPPAAPNPGLDRGTERRLRKGALAIDRRLDLHGMTEAAAHAALDRFVRQAKHDGARVLLIITGKGSVEGGGVLRCNLPRWLSSGEHARHVLRVQSAQPRDGGAGAFYILLRRTR